MNIEKDEKLNFFFEGRPNLSQRRKEIYIQIFEDMHKLFGLTPSELIDEARKQEIPDWENHIIIPMEDRNISKYLRKFLKFAEIERKNSKRTVKEKQGCLRTFYREFEINLPKPVIIKEKKSRARKKDIPSWDDVREVIEKLENVKHKALVLFYATSGLRSGDVLSLTIGDFLEATSEYHDGSLHDLLSKDPKNIIPTWDLDPGKTEDKGNLCITFNTPECVEMIFKYLENRIEKGYSVNETEALFRPISNDKNSSLFYSSNVVAELFRKLINPIVGGRKDKSGRTFFRPQNLRRLFITTCSNNIAKAMFEVEENSNHVIQFDIIALLGGHKPGKGAITLAYDAVDPEDIKPYYEQLIPYLTIGNTDVKTYKSQEVIVMEEQNKALEERLIQLEQDNSQLEALKKLITPETLAILEKLKQEK